MPISLQPTLSDNLVSLRPLKVADFEELFAAAADPLVWNQHPNPERYKREVFEVFFQGAIDSKGALLIQDTKTGAVIGSSRFYDPNPLDKSILIGYTFYAKAYWGQGYNAAAKKLMLNHIFNFVDKVFFHVGAENYRSQRAMEKLGALKVREIAVTYHGESIKPNFEYKLTKP